MDTVYHFRPQFHKTAPTEMTYTFFIHLKREVCGPTKVGLGPSQSVTRTHYMKVRGTGEHRRVVPLCSSTLCRRREKSTTLFTTPLGNWKV